MKSLNETDEKLRSDSALSLEDLLQRHFRLEKFRTGQREIIAAVLAQKDVMAVLPTGGGKSLCFQFPAIVRDQLVVVVSPLIALMKDQVASLQRMGIPSGAIYSGQTESEKREIFSSLNKGGAFVLYLSPERVQKEGFQNWLRAQKIALFAIDEAHCVSQWGHDFRAEYSQLKILKQLRPEIPTLALTASATPTVLDDIARQLELKNPERRVHGFYRPNLYFQVAACEDDEQKLSLVKQAVRQSRHSHPGGRILIYCGTRRVTQELATELEQDFMQVGFYHAGLPTEVRNRVQEGYIQGELKILVATNAFGMGIDQPDVRLVVHFQMPANIDSLSQEMGRAGRDGLHSTCLMLYSPKDKGLQSYFIQSSEASPDVKRLRWKNLDALVNYAEGGECRHSEILTYYKDAQRILNCGHCDICDPRSDRRIETAAPSRIKALATRLRKPRSAAPPGGDVVMDSQQLICFDSLKAWRKQKAKELDTPAFIVFSDKTLRHLTLARPTSLAELKNIYGIGDEKVERYGAELLALLASMES
jgi:ATP-dependent DNA helicase RecQ